LPEGQLDTGLEVFGALVLVGQCGFEAVLDRQQFAGELLDGKFAGLADVFLGTAAHIFGFGLGPQPGIVVLCGLEFGGLEHVFETGHHRGFGGLGRRCGGVAIRPAIGQRFGGWLGIGWA
jgi:hypothetical protein